jgi:hypothetical protein
MDDARRMNTSLDDDDVDDDVDVDVDARVVVFARVDVWLVARARVARDGGDVTPRIALAIVASRVVARLRVAVELWRGVDVTPRPSRWRSRRPSRAAAQRRDVGGVRSMSSNATRALRGTARARTANAPRRRASRRSARAPVAVAASLRDAKVVVVGANGKTGKRCVEYLRANTEAREIVACTRSGTYDGGASDERVRGAEANVATASVAELSNAFSGAKAVVFAASQSQNGGDASRVDRDGVITCARACLRAGVERFVIVSSGAVSKPASPVYIFLNLFGGIMRNKILGEDAVRALYFDRPGQFYTVVRPGGLSEDPARGVGALELNQGDEISGRISREDVAAICIESITRDDAANATFECYNSDAAKPLGEVGLSNMMKATSADGDVEKTGKERRGATWDEIFADLAADVPGAKQQGEGFTL